MRKVTFVFHLVIFFLVVYGLLHLFMAFGVGGYYFFKLDILASHSPGTTSRFILDFVLTYLLFSLISGIPLSVGAAFFLRKISAKRDFVIAISRLAILFVSFSLLAVTILIVFSENIGSEVRLIPFFFVGMLLSLILTGVWYKFPPTKRGWWNRWKIVFAFSISLSITVLMMEAKFSRSGARGNVDLSSATTQPTGSKVLILGIDGADWIVLEKLMNEGVLPNLQKARDAGAWGELGVRIWYTPPSWTTIFSGVDHNIHGVVDFLGHLDENGNLITNTKLDDFIVRTLKGVPLEKIPEGGIHSLATAPLRLWRSFYSRWFYPFERNRELIDATHIQEKRIWQIAADFHKKIGIFSVDLSWPAEKVNGFIVSSRFMRGERRFAVYPEDLYQELELLREGPIEPPKGLPAEELTDLADRLFIGGSREQYERQYREISIARHLWGKSDGAHDLLIFKFRQPDSIKHRLLQFLRPEEFPWFSYDPDKRTMVVENIKLSYRLFDAFLGEVMNSGYTIIVLSDHGFYPVKGNLIYRLGDDIPFNAVKFIEDMGWLRTTPDGNIDWERTIAYSPDLHDKSGININLQGREPNGSVSPEEFPIILDEIRNKFETAVFNDTGEPVFSHVRTDVKGLDLAFFFDAKVPLREVFLFMEGRKIRVDSQVYPLEEYFVFSPLYGGHKKYPRFKEKAGGTAFLLYGEGIKKGVHLTSPEDIDVAPTTLYLLGIPLSEELQGHVLTQAIEDSFLRTYPIERIATYGAHAFDQALVDAVRSGEKNPDAGKEFIENLKALGYLQ